jgi:hypothetical protein
MSMSSTAGGVATSPQQQLPPLKQIRFVNNEGQPPAKRRRINAAYGPCLALYSFCAGGMLYCFVPAYECPSGLRTGELVY